MTCNEITGKYATAKVFTSNIEEPAVQQIKTLCDQSFTNGAKIRIMPDVHAGTGCVIGFTANLGDKVIPSLVGVDIGCGMFVIELGQIDIDLGRLNEVIYDKVPAGMNVHEPSDRYLLSVSNANYSRTIVKSIRCYSKLKNQDRLIQSVGTLGGGNHFIELDVDNQGDKYLVIHSGSRNLGKQVAEYYQSVAVSNLIGNQKRKEMVNEIIAKLKSEGRQREIEQALKMLKIETPDIPKDLCYLTGDDRDWYLRDMQLCQAWAAYNRRTIATEILEGLGLNIENYQSWHTIHNYINFKDSIIRKGAVSAKKDEKLIIPLNMRDGSLICVGKGNTDWNCSAPHGAGRLYSRMKAKETFSVAQYEEQMKGIYSTSIGNATLDECPMAYKPAQEIIDAISPTADIVKHIYPIYNFKAEE